ncbi:hypothetical protein ACFO9Q_14470 [Paenibacillus sp. GCM10023252]|uniref:hypothetical protein n=1 Tax=Paenibacillus sp. GCM10023252 TaxID=3252649 RepID=UPI003619ABDE
MRKIMTTLLLLALLAIPLHQASAEGEALHYAIDSIEVSYAAEFTLHPTAADPNHWLTALAGGTDKPLSIVYGIVTLKTGSNAFEEQFIKLTGENGSERFLHNSLSNEYYDQSHQLLRTSTIQFWSGKQLGSKEVIKDYTKPMKTVHLVKNLDPSGNILGYTLSSPHEGATNQDVASAVNHYSMAASTLVDTIADAAAPLKEVPADENN